MSNKHIFNTSLTWNGANGVGTTDYRAYSRNHIISGKGKPDIPGSSDPVFRGDASRYNPEEFLIASLSSCHMLWYLHLCADAGVIVTAYEDHASGTMDIDKDGGGRFSEVILNPIVTVKDSSMVKAAIELHNNAHKKCFIANSVNFPVKHNPTIRIG
jgi:organic hydroperoxide reductase OsmC/OhrA